MTAGTYLCNETCGRFTKTTTKVNGYYQFISGTNTFDEGSTYTSKGTSVNGVTIYDNNVVTFYDMGGYYIWSYSVDCFTKQ